MKEIEANSVLEIASPSASSLAKEILRHRKLYSEGRPEITDAAFDRLEQQLRAIDPKNAALNRMQSPVDKEDYRLPVPLPSLNKIRPDMGADRWLSTHGGPFVVSDKLDGLAAEIDYNPGKATRAFSSGDDGLHGKNISHLLPYMSVPQSLKKRMVVRVELIMSRADFQKHWSAKYKNARNLATGIKNKTTGIHEAARHYKAVALSVLEPRMKPSVALKQLEALGFLVVPHKTLDVLTVAELSRMFSKRRSSSPYDVDGLVIEQDKITKAPRDNPDHQVAFKDVLGIDSAQVTVKKVTWEESRYGKLTPRVWFDPVRLSGADVQKATGHNALLIWSEKIGPGAVIEIIRSGDVIPKIQKVIKPARSWSPPPGIEGKDWMWNDSEVDIFVHKNMSASDTQRIRAMVHFFTTLGVEGYRIGTATLLYQAGWNTPKSLLVSFAEEYAEIIGPKNAQKLADSIDDNALEVYPADLAYAWGGFGRGAGTKTLWALWKEFGNKGMRALSDKTLVASIAQFQPIVGPVAARAVAENLSKFFKFATSLPIKLLEWKPERVKLKSKKLEDEVVCMTGFRDADLAHDIEQNGGTVSDGMSKNVTILLVKDLNTTSSKAEAARRNKIPIFTAMGFRSKYKI